MGLHTVFLVPRSKRLIGMLTIFMFLAGATTAPAQEAAGFISPNQNDLPPSLERDPSLQDNNSGGPPAYGPRDAKVLLVTFADFSCPACRRASQATHQIAREFPGQVRVEFWHHPLEIHPGADLAAVAAIAAQRQGKFWEMHDLLFANAKRDAATLEQHATDLGLDLEKFRADMGDPSLRARAEEEGKLADALGARATPGFVLNGKVSQGWASWKGFRMMVERELKAANTLAEQGLSPYEIQMERAVANNTESGIYELYRTRILEPNFASADD